MQPLHFISLQTDSQFQSARPTVKSKQSYFPWFLKRRIHPTGSLYPGIAENSIRLRSTQVSIVFGIDEMRGPEGQPVVPGIRPGIEKRDNNSLSICAIFSCAVSLATVVDKSER